MRQNFRYPAMVSVIKLSIEKYKYCKHLFKIVRPSVIMISDYSIFILSFSGTESTYQYLTSRYNLGKIVKYQQRQTALVTQLNFKGNAKKENLN